MVASYTNPGGSGDRTATMTVTTTATVGGGAVTALVDGSQANSFWWSNGQSGREVRFDFVTPKWVAEAKWYQNNASTHGTWKWQGSPDASSWTDIGAAFTLGGSTLQTITEPSVNTATYRYYRMLQTAGVTASSPFLLEIEFLIDSSVTSLPATSAQVTQVTVEEFLVTNPPAQVTQTALEEWASVANVIPPTGGFVGLIPSARATSAPAANSILLTKLTTQQNGVVNAVLIDMPGASSPSGFRALIYDASHSALLAQGAFISSLSADYNRLPLGAPLTLSAGTDYWVGYVSGSATSVTVQSTGGTSWLVSGSQSASSPANPLVSGASSALALMIALELDAAGALPYGFSVDQASGVGLSNYQRTATFSGTGAQGARSVVTRPPDNGGKWYAEVDIGGTINSTTGIGIVADAWGVTEGTGTLAYAFMLLSTGSTNGAVSLGLSYAVGDTIGIAYDTVNDLVWWNKNNGSWFGASSVAGNPVAGTGGQAVQVSPWPISVVGATGTTGVAAQFTLRDTTDALRYTPPSGYAAWSSYQLPTFVPPPPSAPPKGQDPNKDKGKGPQKSAKGPPALRAEGLLEFLAPTRRHRLYSPWALQPVLGQALAESAIGSTAISAAVIRAAALSEGSSTAAAVTSGKLFAGLLADGATTASTLSGKLTANGALASASLPVAALSGKATIRNAALTASSVTAAAILGGKVFGGLLAEGTATSASLAAFRKAVAALSEAGAGSAALAAGTAHAASLADYAVTADQLAALATLLAEIDEADLSEDDLHAVKIMHVAIAEAASTSEIDQWIATTRAFKASIGLKGHRSSATLQGQRSSAKLTGHRSSPNLTGDKDD